MFYSIIRAGTLDRLVESLNRHPQEIRVVYIEKRKSAVTDGQREYDQYEYIALIEEFKV